MTHKIFKYEIPVKETFTLDLPRDADIIRIDDVEGKFFMWVIVDIDPTVPKVTRYFENYKTGQPFKTHPRDLKYLGFFKMFIMQELCLYVFENISTVRPFDWKPTDTGIQAGELNTSIARVMTQEERDAMNRAFWKSAEVVDEGIEDWQEVIDEPARLELAKLYLI